IAARTALLVAEGQRMDQIDAPRKRSLEDFRSYLLLLARMQLDGGPRNRIDASDIVQQTLLEAHAKAGQFAGDDSALAAWMRRSPASCTAGCASCARCWQTDRENRHVHNAAAIGTRSAPGARARRLPARRRGRHSPRPRGGARAASRPRR